MCDGRRVYDLFVWYGALCIKCPADGKDDVGNASGDDFG